MNRPTHPHSFSAHLALVVANVLFGMNFSFFVSIIRHYMAFETLFFARVLFSAVCFIPLTFLYKRFRITRRDFIGILIPTVLVIYGHEFMMLWGAKYTNPLDASTLATMAPIVTLVVSSLIFRERLHWAKIVGIGMGIAGSAVLILGNGWPKMQSEELGNLFMLVSVVAAATNTVFIKPELVRLGTMTVTGWYYVIGVLIAGPFFGRDVFEFDYGSLPPLAVAEIVYVLVLGTTLPNYLLYYGTEKLTSVHTGLYAYLQPIAATALGLYRHQIELGYDNLVAAILIFVGIVLVIITYVKFRFPQRFCPGTDLQTTQFSVQNLPYFFKLRTQDIRMFSHMCIHSLHIFKESYMTQLIQFIVTDSLHTHVFFRIFQVCFGCCQCCDTGSRERYFGCRNKFQNHIRISCFDAFI